MKVRYEIPSNIFAKRTGYLVRFGAPGGVPCTTFIPFVVTEPQEINICFKRAHLTVVGGSAIYKIGSDRRGCGEYGGVAMPE